MTSRLDPDRLITSWLDERAPTREPDGLLRQVLTETSRTPRRLGWLFPERWIPMSLLLNPQAVARATVAVMAVVLALGAGAAFVLAAPPPTVVPSPSPRPDASLTAPPTPLRSPAPTPQGAHNGLIAFEALHLSGKGQGSYTDSDIWVVEPDGSGARPLIAGPTDDWHPVWAPDGTRLAYLSEAAGKPRWKGPVTLMVVNADGSDPIALAPIQEGPYHEDAFAWSPDGTMLVMRSDVPGFGGKIIDSRSGKTIVQLAGYSTAWSPDSAHLLAGLQVIDLQGTIEQTLVKPSKKRPILGDPAWSPDGSKVAYVGGSRWDAHVLVVDVATGKQHDIGGQNGTAYNIQPYRARWSPDGTRIMYSSGKKFRGVVISDPTGSTQVHLDIPGTPAIWSPDSTSVLSYEYHDTQVDSLIVTSVTGSAAPRLIDISAAHADGVGSVSWQHLGPPAVPVLQTPTPTPLPSPSPIPSAPSSPVAARNGLIAFDTSSSTHDVYGTDIWVMNPDGSDARPLITGPTHSRRPLWSPDGSRIAYLAHDPGLPIETEALTVANGDGSDPTVIAQLDGNQTQGTIRWSPDGMMLALDNVFSASYGIRIIDSRSGQTLLEHDGSGPAWSPDSSHLALIDAKGLEIMNLHGTVEQTLVPQSKGSRPHDPAWSPDGTMIAYGTGGFMGKNGNIRVVDISSSAVHETSGHARVALGAPQWSPDGTRIMYAFGRTQHHVVISDPDGSSQVRLDLGSLPLTWSPDGTSILSWDSQGNQLVVTVASAGGTPQPILMSTPHPGWIEHGSWQRLAP